jgi:hypothetical protein
MAGAESVTQAAAAPAFRRANVGWAPYVVALLTVVGLGLRLVVVRDSLFGDELYMFRIVHDHGLGHVFHTVRETEKTPPLGFLLVWATTRLGDSEVWLRLPSLLFGTALVPLAYALGVRTVGRAAGVVAAAILALDPFAIFYATEARAYAALAFLAGLSTLTLLSALEGGGRRRWAAYGLSALALLYTHYLGAPVLVVQAAWAFWVRRDRARELLVVHALIVLAYLPWLPSYLVQQRHSADEARRIALVAPPTFGRFAEIHGRLLFGHPFLGLRELPGRLAAALAVAVILAGLVAAGLQAWRRRPTRLRLSSPVTLLALLAASTPLIIGMYSLLRPHMSFMLPRNWSASLPALTLLVAWLLVSMGRRTAFPALAILLGVLVVSASQALERSDRRTPYNEVAAFIDARSRPGDPIINQSLYQGPVPVALRAYLELPHPIFRGGVNDAHAWGLGRRGARVFTVLPLPGSLAAVRRLGRRTGPGRRFVLVSQRRYRGLPPVLVGEYALGPP